MGAALRAPGDSLGETSFLAVERFGAVQCRALQCILNSVVRWSS